MTDTFGIKKEHNKYMSFYLPICAGENVNKKN